MPRSLSNLEYATFLSEVHPETLGLPAWGGITLWGNQYVLMFQLPSGDPLQDEIFGYSGQWALSDVSDGIPYGATVIPIQTYIGSVNKYISPSGWSVWDVGSDAMQAALKGVAAAAALAAQATQFSVQQISDALQKVLGGAAAGLGSALWPLAIVAAAIIFLYVKPTSR
jgi:hypothetical protein